MEQCQVVVERVPGPTLVVVGSRGRRGGGDLNGGGIHFVSTLCELLYQDRTSCT